MSENYLPESLRKTPKAVLPYLVVRDHFLQRLHQQKAGYWQADGEGMHPLTRSEQAALLDQLGGGGDAPFVRVAEDLLARGDGPMALRVSEMGLLRYPASEPLKSSRTKALSMLIERYNLVDPFRFIIYSQWASSPLSPIGVAPGDAR